MILSDIGIKDALEKGILEISPKPSEDQYTTSAVDLYLGSEFKCWDWERLSTAGTKTILNLAEHSFRTTAGSFLLDYPVENDGSYILPPYSGKSVPVLAMTRERVYLKPESSCAARVEGRSLAGPPRARSASDGADHSCRFQRADYIGDGQLRTIPLAAKPRKDPNMSVGN